MIMKLFIVDVHLCLMIRNLIVFMIVTNQHIDMDAIFVLSTFSLVFVINLYLYLLETWSDVYMHAYLA